MNRENLPHPYTNWALLVVIVVVMHYSEEEWWIMFFWRIIVEVSGIDGCIVLCLVSV